MVADKTLDNHSRELNEFEQLLNNYDYKFNKGDLVKGTVVAYDSHGVLIDIGAKTTAKVPLKELSNIPTKTPQDIAKIGDEREFLIIKEEDEDGQFTLSLKKVSSAYSWKRLEELKQEDATVEAKVTS